MVRPDGPWARTPGLGFALWRLFGSGHAVTPKQLKRWQVPVSPLPSLLAPGALPSDLVPNGALTEH
jgi:hypothetical protein